MTDKYGIVTGKDLVLGDGIFYIFDKVENTKIGNETIGLIEGNTRILIKDGKVMSQEKFDKDQDPNDFKFFINKAYGSALGSRAVANS
jgi:hypothetical protein